MQKIKISPAAQLKIAARRALESQIHYTDSLVILNLAGQLNVLQYRGRHVYEITDLVSLALTIPKNGPSMVTDPYDLLSTIYTVNGISNDRIYVFNTDLWQPQVMQTFYTIRRTNQ